ncbi:Phage capsid scaffolding family protein [Oleispira antarctica RB-8]|uniref:Phage capsid scaffolding family protein n=1 Tax=Oleispira antarctica RB-8 TaxID=698738 RepID=R4YPB5_OLEAN|nr:Phage capsid scaffolding family protein [Oleispira antarctica RB-8]
MLLTEYLTFATAGATVDGRAIEESWLVEVAESYDTDVYTAMIDADHEMDWFGCYGHVNDVRLGKNKNGETILEGRISPNIRLIEMNQRGQRTFFSISLEEDFQGKGKHYLFRLALTDSPASIGTSQIKMFSAKGKTGIKTNPLTLSFKLEGSEEDDSNEASMISKLYHKFFPNKPTALDELDSEDEPMNEKQFAAMQAQNVDVIAGITGMTQAFTAFTEKLAATDSAKEGDEESAPGEESDKEFAAKFAKISESLEAVTEKMGAMETKFSALSLESDGTTVPPNGGNAEDEIEFI